MRLHLVDGTYELFRAHFSGRPGHRAPDGREVKATLGMAASLLALLHEAGEAVTHVAVAFDRPIRSFRNDLWAGYKSEEGVEPELLAQLEAAEEAARALGLVVWSMDALEADDALATAAARFRDEVEQVRILTPDKDLGQCLRGRRVVQVDRMRGRETDEAALLARRGIQPESVPDWLALVGDTADGIPGLPGFGERTASALLAVYGHLEDVPADPARWPAGVRGAAKLARALEEGREAALLYRRLATLVTDAPLAEGLEALRWPGLSRERLGAWAASLGAERLVQGLEARPARWAGPGGAPPPAAGQGEARDVAGREGT
ncbi:5'-3' exonuclease [Anaeromyxobacter dehalogenans 2CP-1]|uniref:5'-3' exonuclease n=1 Tax=Anaeromyxobacter dehalogenans (strain ATCC BAA-258 / DSM 21875 / 2CP-1) TaxID=455488 RepID=B8J5X2_ANAD2|nr:5'-3' exonuclease H3TH domain-containing protein [Anaeromyxobacter dehalogenans]ACL65069.1 5'-3' exonuclease [Anaeromyxobacter dehalogenans 2CP-1]